jgi:glutathione S-transferase
MSTSAPVTVIGNHMSPFVRKVLAVCELKSIPYQLDSLVPFFGTERFTALSPQRRIPVLIDGETVLTDSGVICEYLEDKWPATPILPRSPAARARARYLEKFADTRMTEVMLWGVFGRALVAPAIFKSPRDMDAITRTLNQDVPEVMDILETLSPERGFLDADRPGLADLSVASHAINFRWGARKPLDGTRWPRAVGWIERTEAAEPLRRLNAIGETMLRAPPDGHRPILEAAGVPVAPETVGGAAAPRRGPLTRI